MPKLVVTVTCARYPSRLPYCASLAVEGVVHAKYGGSKEEAVRALIEEIQALYALVETVEVDADSEESQRLLVE